jgi:hypothetical protein
VRLAVWEQLLPTLRSDVERDVVRPRARLRELVDRIVRQVDAAGAQQRRDNAREGRAVSYRRRDDGLVDLFAFGLTGPLAQACLSRIRDAAAPLGPADERTADQRRLDALVSLLLGREQLPLDAQGERLTDGPTAGVRRVWVQRDVPGPLRHRGELAGPARRGARDDRRGRRAGRARTGRARPARRAAARLPRAAAVFVDEHGLPVAEGPTARVERGDVAGLREALLRLAGSPPPAERIPRHPDDHPPGPPPGPPDGPPGPAPGPPPDSPPSPTPGSPLSRSRATPPDRTSARPRVLTHPHPPGTPGPYRPPASLRRFLRVRAPRCEWPGCGARAACCDQDHDLAHPYGPTCGCNLGTLCRRHHRVKQTGWTKTRRPDGVRWTSPAGRTWLSPHQHTAPAVSTRQPAPPPATTGDEHLSPLEHEDLLWDLDPSDPRLDGAFTETAPVEDGSPTTTTRS